MDRRAFVGASLLATAEHPLTWQSGFRDKPKCRGDRTFRERGAYPKELAALSFKEYRQVHFKPYRLVYRIIDAHAVVYLIADGRRDMPSSGAAVARGLSAGN